MVYKYTALVTILSIIVVLVFMFRVGLGRGKYKVDAPKMSGHETWDKLFRIHANSVEQAVIFFPALWLAALTGGDVLAASFGVVWIVGRIIYSQAYSKNPKSRAPGMVMTFGSTAILAMITLVQIIRDVLA